MLYNIRYNNWNSVFAVPADLVDNHLPLVGVVQLKIILLILRRNKKTFTSAEIADALHLPEPEVIDAVNYWIQAGFLDSNNQEDEASFYQAAKTTVKNKYPHPDGITTSERIKQSGDLEFLMSQAQSILGRTISPALSSILVAGHDDYGLPVEVIIMLLVYVKKINKTNTNYIEAIIKDWSEDNIFSIEAAESKLHELTDMSAAWRKIENCLGIKDRTPSKKEQAYVKSWIFDWKFSMDMIQEAYERCVNSTGKMTMQYINKILERWHLNGIKTIEQANQENQSKAYSAQKSKPGKLKQPRTYNIDDIEKMDFTTEFSEYSEDKDGI